MGGSAKGADGPDLRSGIRLADLEDGGIGAGVVDGEPVLLYRESGDVWAVGGSCTHYGAALVDGMAEGGVIRCPWHHACFSLRTGEVLAAPALDGLPRYRTSVSEGVVRVTERVEPARAPVTLDPLSGDPMVIVGAGAAGSAAAETLRAEGYGGRVVVVDPDADAPYDRPNLSKDYLAGSAPAAWLPLRGREFYEERGIERVQAGAGSLDVAGSRVHLTNGETLRYSRLLLATGAEPVRPDFAGADLPHVHVLRSLRDCERLIEAAGAGRRVLVAGGSFIGMEAAAALRSRGLEVLVVAPEQRPFERTLGTELGGLLQATHERNGVAFRLGRKLASIREGEVELDDGTVVPADLMLLGLGVRPRTELAATAGITGQDGVPVDACLETRRPGVYAAGDIALYPEPRAGRRVRVEHWVVAQRQGQTAARNMLGRGEPFTSVPFFWTQQFDVAVRYVGHAGPDAVAEVDGSVSERDCTIRFVEDGAVRAVATVGRDRACLEAELMLEREGVSRAGGA
jgi:apoptosis-inducing factor 3